MAGLKMLQWFSCSENHLPRVEGLDQCSLLQYLSLAQNNLQQVCGVWCGVVWCGMVCSVILVQLPLAMSALF